jgi:hypothetical protein
MLLRRERAPDIGLRKGLISFCPMPGKIGGKENWLSKALILLRKSTDLSNLSDLSARPS